MVETKVTRRLAAILAADMVGYSRLVEADEAGTIARQRAHRAELIDPKISEHGGRIVKTMGDGLLVEFGSVIDAIQCAVEVQLGMEEREVAMPAGRRIQYRVGINLGEVVIDEEDILGDGVNVAARLEGLAMPGGICISGKVYEEVRDRTDLAFDALGERQVKNMSRPIRVWRWVAGGQASASSVDALPPLPLPDKPSIAVLPFDNMSDDPEQEYFSDGITEDIITDLSKLSGLFVIARNSAFAYKGRTVPIPEICRALGVRHAVEGSVRKAGNRIRVTAQLIDGTTGGHLWAERYDRDLADVFAVQDELTREIVGVLRVRLTANESERMSADETDSLEAYDLVLRAIEQYNRVTREANAEARQLVEQALTKAPTYARAHALLATNHLQVVSNGWSLDRTPVLDLAYASACRAVELDDALSAAHHAKGYVALWRRQFDEAVREMDTALRLEPNDAVSYSRRAMILAWSGDPIEAVRSAEAALRLDPLRSLSLFDAGLAYYEAGRYDEALAQFRRGATRRPDYLPVFAYQSATLTALGRPEEAKASLARALELNPNISQRVLRDLLPFRDAARGDRFIAALAEAGLPE